MGANGIALGLIAAFCWGVADFCARWAARVAGTFRTLLVVQVLGITGLLALGLPLGLLRLRGVPLAAALAAAGISLIILAGAGLLYRALAVGTLALVSPIAASFAAVTATLALLAGERPSPLVLGGIALTLIGVVVASTVPSTASELPKDVTELARRHWPIAPGLLEALGAALLFGVGYWSLGFVILTLGGITVALIGKIADFIALGMLAPVLLVHARLTRNARAHPPRRTPQHRAPAAAFWLFVVPVGLLDTGANVAYNLGISVAPTAVVVALSSLFSAVTVLLAWIFLHERLAVWQWAGVAAILIGILLVNW